MVPSVNFTDLSLQKIPISHLKHSHSSILPTFQQKLEKSVDETHLTGTPVVKVLSVVAHSSLGNDTNENKENDSEKNCKKTKSNSR
jgi:hypothetical protein